MNHLSEKEDQLFLRDHMIYEESSESGNYQVMWKKDQKNDTSFSGSVPDGQVFVLGDNRNGAQDSRKFGYVPLTDVTGKAKQIWFSLSPEDGVRWARIGKLIDVNR